MAETPQPTYTVEKSDGDFEIRHYVPQIVADVTLTGEEATANKAFRILAQYIFKEYPSGQIGMTAPVTVQNTQSIGMTAPVTVEKGSEKVFMRFYLPERYTLATIPQPEDERILLKELPARRVAVVAFNWWLSEARATKQEKHLQAWLAQQGLSSVGVAERQSYNPPWTLPWWRHNEIWLPLP